VILSAINELSSRVWGTVERKRFAVVNRLPVTLRNHKKTKNAQLEAKTVLAAFLIEDVGICARSGFGKSKVSERENERKIFLPNELVFIWG
jgi:hypothetical protein